MKKIILPAVIALFAMACQKDTKDTVASVNQEETVGTPGSGKSSRTTRGVRTHHLNLNSSESRIPPGYEVPVCVVQTETVLTAGQTINTGTVSVWNDENNVYVAYQTDGDYRLKKTHLFVGGCGTIPTNNAGNPRIGNFPYQTQHGTGVSLFVYAIPRSSLPLGCLCVAAHAEVVAYNASGAVTFSQTGWGFGEQINDGGSWAMKFGYCIQDCDEGPR